jgi:hypothetical protein
MRFKSLVVTRLPAKAMALYPFMLFKSKSLKYDSVIINHEKIHFKQQQELLILPFYILYLLHYLFNRLKYKGHHQAYLNICFEREAYTNEWDMQYLHKRKPFAWISFLHR